MPKGVIAHRGLSGRVALELLFGHLDVGLLARIYLKFDAVQSPAADAEAPADTEEGVEV